MNYRWNGGFEASAQGEGNNLIWLYKKRGYNNKGDPERQEFLHYRKDHDSGEGNFYYDSICAHALPFCTKKVIVEIERGFLALFYCLALLQAVRA